MTHLCIGHRTSQLVEAEWTWPNKSLFFYSLPHLMKSHKYMIILACKWVSALVLLFTLHSSPVAAARVRRWGNRLGKGKWVSGQGQDRFRHAAGTPSPFCQVSKVWCTCGHWWPVAWRTAVKGWIFKAKHIYLFTYVLGKNSMSSLWLILMLQKRLDLNLKS